MDADIEPCDDCRTQRDGDEHSRECGAVGWGVERAAGEEIGHENFESCCPLLNALGLGRF
jgi:hypothetical protein